MNEAGLQLLLDKHRRGWSLEQSFYTHPEIFEFEWEHIWKKYWLFAGTLAEIPAGCAQLQPRW